MANVCEFRMTIRGNAEGLDKVETVFRDADPSLCFCRFWTDCVSAGTADTWRSAEAFHGPTRTSGTRP